MNSSDSDVVAALLNAEGYRIIDNKESGESSADIILLNTCAIREKAEERVKSRLRSLKGGKRTKQPVVGVLGCMGERLREKLLEDEKLCDVVSGPDSYRDLPRLLSNA